MAMKVTDINANCIIGEGSVFEGKFYVNGSVLIEGKFQGDIRTNDQVVIGPTGKVKTDISAKKVTVSGTIIGNIHASEEVNLLSTGKVLGNITTSKINVEHGVITSGKVVIYSENDSDVEKFIDNSFGEDTDSVFREFEKKTNIKERKGITLSNDKIEE